ncbi:hypothetical protein BCV70DRAFT_230358 [Testicularia cyperi]|uniref:Uncharacterized protein n=1 Tax=Testicularia cyperi TaxID=1882483 RepID=A0A317XV81_9BASI|nr:hypothetical protein BCV70DRAFT_230358 [Testicularia cyperi]
MRRWGPRCGEGESLASGLWVLLLFAGWPPLLARGSAGDTAVWRFEPDAEDDATDAAGPESGRGSFSRSIHESTAPMPLGRSRARSQAAQSSQPAASSGIDALSALPAFRLEAMSPWPGIKRGAAAALIEIGGADAASAELGGVTRGLLRHLTQRQLSPQPQGGGTNSEDMSTACRRSSMLGAATRAAVSLSEPPEQQPPATARTPSLVDTVRFEESVC